MSKGQPKLLFRKGWSDFIREEFGDAPDIGYKVYNAIIDYFYDGVLPNDRLIKVAIGSIIKDIDEDKEAYAERVEKNRENAKKGGNPAFKKGKKNPYYDTESVKKPNQKVVDVVLNEADLTPKSTNSTPETDITEMDMLDNQMDIKDNPIYNNIIELFNDNTKVSSSHNSLNHNNKKNIEKKDGELSLELDATYTPENSEPVKPKTKTKVVTVKTDEEVRFDDYMKSNYPRVCKMAKPLTLEKYKQLVSDYGLETTTDTLNALENCAHLNQKYVSAYMTLNNWCKRDSKNKHYGSNIRTIQQPARPASFAESDLANELMAHFATEQSHACQ